MLQFLELYFIICDALRIRRNLFKEFNCCQLSHPRIEDMKTLAENFKKIEEIM